MNKKRIYAVLSSCLIFIGANMYLIAKADSKVDRKSYVHEWEPTNTGNLQNSVKKEGVLSPAEESFVYFDESYGTFQEFLVEEGDQVTAGTELFTYEAEDTIRQEQLLMSEVEQLEAEIVSIENHIRDLNSLRPSSTSTIVPRTPIGEDEFPPDEGLEASSLEIDYLAQQEIAEKELDIERLESKIANYQRQLADLQSYEKDITVQSVLDGVVKKVSRELDNPVIIVSSTSTVVQGDLNEQETLKVTEGKESIIHSSAVENSMKGFVTYVASLPSETMTEEGSSSYPFKIQFEEDENLENLRPGFHVSLSIITEEAKDVLTVPIHSLIKEGVKNYLLIANQDGLLVKKEVTAGMESGGKVEIRKGIKEGDIYVKDPNSRILPKSTFVTPLKIDKLTINSIKNADKHTILENILLGILERK